MSFSTDDTIVAVATPPGRGGLGVVRISGPASQAIAARLLDRQRPLEPRRATIARVRHTDEVVATLFVAPHSYTRQDVVELSAHGSPPVLQAIVAAAVEAGARLAQPGEFTLRAFLNGRLDLVQSEAVGDLVDAATPLQARVAFDQLEGTLTGRIAAIDARLFDLVARLEASLDFPDEGYHFIEPSELSGAIAGIREQVAELLDGARRGRLIREGAQAVLAGRPNVGKSSIFNELAGAARAIVTTVPGTTRDLLTERVEVEGVPITLVDTAGVRETVDAIELEGVERARLAASVARLVLVVLDRSEPLTEDDRRLLDSTAALQRLVVLNKSDLPAAFDFAGPAVLVSAVTGSGLSDLRREMAAALTLSESLRDLPAVTNLRHVRLLETAASGLEAARQAAATGAPEEFVLSHLQEARVSFEAITGKRTTDDLLQHIFERFCIGK